MERRKKLQKSRDTSTDHRRALCVVTLNWLLALTEKL